jgi:small nuclear ribonucleoprotein G
MSRASQPELKSQPSRERKVEGQADDAEFMDRRLYLHIQGGRAVSGILRGFDMFLNLVIDNAFEELGGGVRKPCGMIVSRFLSPRTSGRQRNRG